MYWFATAILLGELTVLLDGGSRLFSSCLCSPRALLLRILLLVSTCAMLGMPLALFYTGATSSLVRAFLWASSLLSVAAFVHFMAPYRFGIRKVKALDGSGRPLAGGIWLRQVRLEMRELPDELNSLKCLVLSDLHCNNEAALSRLSGALDELKDEEFDIVLVLGDFGENADLLSAVVETLSRIGNRLGIFCVRGNHDFDSGREQIIEQALAHYSIRLLSNDAHVVPGAGLLLLGTELPWKTGQPFHSKGSRFCIGLMHTPDNLFLSQRAGVNLCVAAHTHGGGVQLPLVGPLLVPSKYGRFLNHGVFRFRDTWLLVTAGLGYPVERLWRKPELVSIVLEKTAQPTLTEHLAHDGGDRAHAPPFRQPRRAPPTFPTYADKRASSGLHQHVITAASGLH